MRKMVSAIYSLVNMTPPVFFLSFLTVSGFKCVHYPLGNSTEVCHSTRTVHCRLCRRSSFVACRRSRQGRVSREHGTLHAVRLSHEHDFQNGAGRRRGFTASVAQLEFRTGAVVRCPLP